MAGRHVILLAAQASPRRTIVVWTLYDLANSASAAATAMAIGAVTSPPLSGVADHAGARWNFSSASVSCLTELIAAVHAGAAHEAAGLRRVGAADRRAGTALRRRRESAAMDAGHRGRLFRRHQEPVLGRRDPGRHGRRRDPGGEPNVHGHAGAGGPRGGVLRLLFARGQDRRDLGPARVRQRVLAALRQPARGDRGGGGTVLRRRAAAVDARERGRPDGDGTRAHRGRALLSGAQSARIRTGGSISTRNTKQATATRRRPRVSGSIGSSNGPWP